jgi:hypothetical protein
VTAVERFLNLYPNLASIGDDKNFEYYWIVYAPEMLCLVLDLAAAQEQDE